MFSVLMDLYYYGLQFQHFNLLPATLTLGAHAVLVVPYDPQPHIIFT